MKYEIQNGATRGKAFKVIGGTFEVKPGETEIVDVEFEITEEKIEEHLAAGVVITILDKKALAARARAEAEAAQRAEAERKAAEEATAAKAVEARKALVDRATELKLSFAAETTDEQLQALIAEAEKPAEPPPVVG